MVLSVGFLKWPGEPELTIVTSKPALLLSVHEDPGGGMGVQREEADVETQAGINTVSTVKYAISNTGNIPIPDVDVSLTFSDSVDCEVFGGVTPDSNFQEDFKELITHVDGSEQARVTVDVLNPGEAVFGTLIVVNIADEITAAFRRLGVRIVHRANVDSGDADQLIDTAMLRVSGSFISRMIVELCGWGARAKPRMRDPGTF